MEIFGVMEPSAKKRKKHFFASPLSGVMSPLQRRCDTF